MEKGHAAIDEISSLRSLGSGSTEYALDSPNASILETFPNRTPEADYFVNLHFPEFTSLCPKTGQPDFASIDVRYVPGQKCLESKSVKLYYFAYRNFGAFQESIVNKILRDFVEACAPRRMRVTGRFTPRGALGIVVEATYDHLVGFKIVSMGETND